MKNRLEDLLTGETKVENAFEQCDFAEASLEHCRAALKAREEKTNDLLLRFIKA